MSLFRPRVAAFTLIELLIVVAIIAILAAIAVPNFLEAQTRAKVSRTRADMRSLATAMEAYRVDNNRYPIPADEDGVSILQGHLAGEPHISVRRQSSPFEARVSPELTTPIAYIASRPEDPFAATRAGESRLYSAFTYDYMALRQSTSPPVNWFVAYNRFFRDLTDSAPPSGLAYWFYSFGPDKDHDADVPHAGPTSGPHQHNDGALYDPTNGTISSGDLFYFGPGFGFSPRG